MTEYDLIVIGGGRASNLAFATGKDPVVILHTWHVWIYRSLCELSQMAPRLLALQPQNAMFFVFSAV